MASDGRAYPLSLLFIALSLAGLPIAACAAAPRPALPASELIDLAPDRRASWSGEKLLAPLTRLFLGSGYWYEPRELRVETTPSDAVLELFYVRANMQRGYEQGEAPARVRLPARIDTSDRDVLSIRASAPGYRTATLQLPVRSRQATVQIDLEPVANRLLAVEHRYFAGSGVLRLLTRERSTLRLQKGAGGFTLVLLETSLDPVALAQLGELQSGLLLRAEAQALGEDLLLLVGSPAVADGRVELRASQDEDRVRGVHALSLVLAPADAEASRVRRARERLAGLDASSVSECSLRFDRALRASLDPELLARSLSVYDPFIGRYVRAALRRLGEIAPDHALLLVDGTRFRADVPLEFEAAAGRAGEAIGLLALFRDLVAALEPAELRAATLRSVIAPGLSRERFAVALAGAEAVGEACRSAR